MMKPMNKPFILACRAIFAVCLALQLSQYGNCQIRLPLELEFETETKKVSRLIQWLEKQK